MVGGLQQLFLAHVARLQFRLGPGIELRAVVIDHAHAETECPAPRDALADTAHAEDAERAAVDVGAGEHVEAPLLPFAAAQEMLALGDAAGRRHQQRKAEICRGFGQHVGRVGAGDAVARHRIDIEVVVADSHVGADLQLGTCGEHRLVDLHAVGGEGAVLALEPADQFIGRPFGIVLVGFDLEMALQFFDRLRKHGAGDEDFRFCVGRCHVFWRVDGGTGGCSISKT